MGIDKRFGPVPDEFKGSYKHTLGSIWLCGQKIGDVPVIDVRGWGWLTGAGALNIPADKAAQIQDQFGDWIAETLTKAANEQSSTEDK